jgi:DNA transformation protein
MDHGFIAWLQELFAEFGPVTARAMFGGHGLYRDGIIFAIAIDDAVYLKVDAATRARFEARGCAPFVYARGRQPLAMSYWSVPAEAMDSPQAMLPWAQLAWEAALRKPVGRRRR